MITNYSLVHYIRPQYAVVGSCSVGIRASLDEIWGSYGQLYRGVLPLLVACSKWRFRPRLQQKPKQSTHDRWLLRILSSSCFFLLIIWSSHFCTFLTEQRIPFRSLHFCSAHPCFLRTRSGIWPAVKSRTNAKKQHAQVGGEQRVCPWNMWVCLIVYAFNRKQRTVSTAFEAAISQMLHLPTTVGISHRLIPKPRGGQLAACRFSSSRNAGMCGTCQMLASQWEFSRNLQGLPGTLWSTHTRKVLQQIRLESAWYVYAYVWNVLIYCLGLHTPPTSTTSVQQMEYAHLIVICDSQMIQIFKSSKPGLIIHVPTWLGMSASTYRYWGSLSYHLFHRVWYAWQGKTPFIPTFKGRPGAPLSSRSLLGLGSKVWRIIGLKPKTCAESASQMLRIEILSAIVIIFLKKATGKWQLICFCFFCLTCMKTFVLRPQPPTHPTHPTHSRCTSCLNIYYII